MLSGSDPDGREAGCKPVTLAYREFDSLQAHQEFVMIKEEHKLKP